MTLRDRSWKGWRYYRTPGGVRNEGLITQKLEIWRAFSQFSRYEVQTSQTSQGLFEAGREGDDDSTVPKEAQK